MRREKKDGILYSSEERGDTFLRDGGSFYALSSIEMVSMHQTRVIHINIVYRY